MVFYVSIGLLRESGMWLLTSLSVSTVSGLELIIPSVFANSALKFSLFKLHQYVLSKASRAVLAVQIWRFQTSPIYETVRGLFSQVIESLPVF